MAVLNCQFNLEIFLSYRTTFPPHIYSGVFHLVTSRIMSGNADKAKEACDTPSMQLTKILSKTSLPSSAVLAAISQSPWRSPLQNKPKN
ncbi:hypothetical protein I7I53_08776 [Histoplasma capsulatum var. duboisii H88]|uniref:Uncharacterized protein n=1 Tax=Ajellomyces capsulatus (strain H88) TaxID=544711 RepID=A0A8A1L8E5_AJEC8|nr:hypothetical protein I7I53_08776 [Histoplasma capsulatum var. duboisii H88]